MFSLGSIFHKTIKVKSPLSLLKKVYRYTFGELDLHSHIRFRTVKKYWQPLEKNLEIGSARGLMTYAFLLETKKPILGLSYLDSEVKEARDIQKKIGIDKVIFRQSDILKLENIGPDSFDQCLLIDVLEHIDDDSRALQNVRRILKPQGYLVISVPTPNYPKYFGQKFAQKIGHRRDGYYFEDLAKLLRTNGFTIVKYQYYTNLISSSLCSIWYKNLQDIKLIKPLVLPLFNFISLFDFFPSKNHSCSLAVLAKKL
ncbi:MAG: class I SAM-dependent methyltransferase [Patescibacteria group bacterium]